MTSGERAVWAAEFVRSRGGGMPIGLAAQSASVAVKDARLSARSKMLDDEARAMLDDMLSTGADR